MNEKESYMPLQCNKMVLHKYNFYFKISAKKLFFSLNNVFIFTAMYLG